MAVDCKEPAPRHALPEGSCPFIGGPYFGGDTLLCTAVEQNKGNPVAGGQLEGLSCDPWSQSWREGTGRVASASG